jgi:hypothetical protein
VAETSFGGLIDLDFGAAPTKQNPTHSVAVELAHEAAQQVGTKNINRGDIDMEAIRAKLIEQRLLAYREDLADWLSGSCHGVLAALAFCFEIYCEFNVTLIHS